MFCNDAFQYRLRQIRDIIRCMDSRFPAFCLVAVLAVFIWSMIGPYDWPTWVMETLPVMIAVPILLVTRKKFPLTNLSYGLIAVHAVILIIGAHYTYARVPLFDWIRDEFGFARNSYDGLGHFAQGFVPALIGRELLIRTSTLQRGKWMFALLVLSCLGISAIYELLEWGAAIMAGEGADEFLSTQGDIWDTQKDMALAGIGAVSSLLLLAKWHDRQLAKIK